MSAALIYAMPHAAPWLASGVPLVQKVVALFGLLGLAMVVYFACAFLIGGADLGMIRRNIKRKPKAPAPPQE
jgi:putative peptidoglycan lipid II flippase